MSIKRKPLALDPAAFASVAVPQPDPVAVATESMTATTSEIVHSMLATDSRVEEQRTPKVTRPRDSAARIGTRPRARENKTRETTEAPSPRQQASRVGKVQVQAWVTEETRRRLKILAVSTDRTIDEILTEAIDALLSER